MNNIRTSRLLRTHRLSLYTNNYICRGGNWHPPSIPLYKQYRYHRRVDLETVTRTIHHDVAPEHFVGLFSREYPSTYAAVWRLLGTGLLCLPLLGFLMWVSNNMGSALFPIIRDCPDHAHMLPGLIGYLKRNNFNKSDDFLGRMNGEFYRTTCYEELDKTNRFLERIKRHGIRI